MQRSDDIGIKIAQMLESIVVLYSILYRKTLSTMLKYIVGVTV